MTIERRPETLVIENLIRIDPVELMRDNPAALIVNEESYQGMNTRFIIGKNDPPKVVRIISYSSEHGEVIRLFVEDGMTRTKFHADHKGQRRPEYPDYSFDTMLVADVTDDEIENTRVVRPEEYEETKKRGALTMVQYLRSIIPPTVEHAKIAPDRIAAHLINAWDNMTGEISNRYSALAALSLLSSPEAPIGNNTLLLRYLDKQPELMVGETLEERNKLKKALLDIAEVITQSTLVKQHVAESAFVLVSAQSPVIGGETEARRQIYGLLHTPSIERNLQRSFHELSVREQKRDELDKVVTKAFNGIKGKPNNQQIIESIGEALRDNLLDYADLLKVVTSETPDITYAHIKRRVNVNRLSEAYKAIIGGSEGSENEQKLIANLGGVTYLPSELDLVTTAIQDAQVALTATTSLRIRLETERDALLTIGLKVEEIDQIIAETIRLSNWVLSTERVQTLNNRVRGKGGLQETINRAMRNIEDRTLRFEIGQLADEVFTQELQTVSGGQIRGGLANYILRIASDPGDPHRVDPKNKTQIKVRLTTLKELDKDIREKVISGEWRYVKALREQDGRRKQTIDPQQDQVTSQPDLAISIITPSPIDVVEPQVIETVESADRQTVENIRKTKGNQTVRDLLEASSPILRQVDVDPTEIEDSTREIIDVFLREIGRIRFGHPDLVRGFGDTERLRNENQRLRQLLAQRELSDNIRDSQTRI